MFHQIIKQNKKNCCEFFKQIDEWPGDWTETKARDVCQFSITEAVGDDILETSHTKSDGYIETCMFDIKVH